MERETGRRELLGTRLHETFVFINIILVPRSSCSLVGEARARRPGSSGDTGFEVVDFRTFGHFRFKRKLEDSVLNFKAKL